MTILIVSVLGAALVLLLVVQGISRHRRLVRREESGQTTLPRSTWVVFGAAAAFFVFAVFILPLVLRR